MLTATIWGGAGEHGRSCYHAESGGISVLLDCGVKKTGLGEYPLLDAECIPDLSTVFLSHAHEDHSVALPLLYQHGYRGEVWTTRATLRQLPDYFELWSKHVQRSGGKLPYTAEEAEGIRYRCLEETAPAGAWFEAAPGVRACWGPSGHLPGSVWLLLEIGGKLLFYSGDYCSESSLLRSDLPVLEDTMAPDLAIIDAAYGDRTEVQADEMNLLISKIRQVLERKGHVLLPVPMYGRGQELLTLISEAIEDARIVCEAELLSGFRELETFADWLWPEALERTQQALRRVEIVREEHERAAVLAGHPSIIFVTDGLLESPIARAYYQRLCSDSRHALLFTGHLYEGCYGAQVYEAHRDGSSLKSKNSINREDGINRKYGSSRKNEESTVDTEKRCEVLKFHYKIHQGLPDVSRLLRLLQPKQALLVHASKEQTDRLAAQLTAQGFIGLHSLIPGDRIQV